MRKLSEKAAEFCRLIVYEREAHARAYLHAKYGDTKNANVKAYQLLQKDYIQAEIRRLELKIAAQAIVDRLLMTKKYFELAEICGNERDRPTQKGCLDSICKLYGLSVDVAASGDGAMAELTEERRRIAALIPDSLLIENRELPELPSAPSEEIKEVVGVKVSSLEGTRQEKSLENDEISEKDKMGNLEQYGAQPFADDLKLAKELNSPSQDTPGSTNDKQSGVKDGENEK